MVMAEFARECLSNMDTLILMLVNHLGQDTAELKLRVGLHTGEVSRRKNNGLAL
jgi:class 3 adenylate cyclase